MRFIIIGLILLCSTNGLLAQNYNCKDDKETLFEKLSSSNIEYDLNRKVNEQLDIGHVYNIETISVEKYISKSKPEALETFKNGGYSTSHHQNPIQLLRSMLSVSSAEWLKSLYYEDYKDAENATILKLHNKQGYFDSVTCNVYSEIYFTYNSVEYCGLLTDGIYFAGLDILFPLCFEKHDGKWYATFANNATSFVSILFLKQQYVASLLSYQETKFNKLESLENTSLFKEFLSENFQGNLYEPNFYWDYLTIKEKSKYFSLMVGNEYNSTNTISIEKRIEINISKTMCPLSIVGGFFHVYQYLSNHFRALGYPQAPSEPELSGYKIDIDQNSPEYATLKFHFIEDMSEKEAMCLGEIDNIDNFRSKYEQLFKYRRIHWGISFTHKIMFANGCDLYCMLFIKESYDRSMIDEDMDIYKEDVKYELLTYRNGKWWIIKHSVEDEQLNDFIWVLSRLSFKGLKAAFIDTEDSEDNSGYKQIGKKFRGSYGEVYINNIKNRYLYEYPFISPESKTNYSKQYLLH